MPRSQTQLLKDFYRAVLQEGELAGWPYSLLSAATHGRFRQAKEISHRFLQLRISAAPTECYYISIP